MCDATAWWKRTHTQRADLIRAGSRRIQCLMTHSAKVCAYERSFITKWNCAYIPFSNQINYRKRVMLHISIAVGHRHDSREM